MFKQTNRRGVSRADLRLRSAAEILAVESQRVRPGGATLTSSPRSSTVAAQSRRDTSRSSRGSKLRHCSVSVEVEDDTRLSQAGEAFSGDREAGIRGNSESVAGHGDRGGIASSGRRSAAGVVCSANGVATGASLLVPALMGETLQLSSCRASSLSCSSLGAPSEAPFPRTASESAEAESGDAVGRETPCGRQKGDGLREEARVGDGEDSESASATLLQTRDGGLDRHRRSPLSDVDFSHGSGSRTTGAGLLPHEETDGSGCRREPDDNVAGHLAVRPLSSIYSMESAPPPLSLTTDADSNDRWHTLGAKAGAADVDSFLRGFSRGSTSEATSSASPVSESFLWFRRCSPNPASVL